ncbi:MAG TPA: TonB-dependent receptor, partial [Pyrinomonadaceae bacterium]
MIDRNWNCRILAAVLAVMAFASVTSGAGNETILPPPRGHVNDFAGVLDDASRDRLENILENLKHRTGIDLVVAMVKTSGEKDLYDYSLRVANEWNVAQNDQGKRVLTVIAVDTGRFFTQSSRSAQKELPNGLIGYMGRRMRPQFDSRSFKEGLLTGIEAFANIVGQTLNFTFETLDRPATDHTAQIQPNVRKPERNEPAAQQLKPKAVSPPVVTTRQPERALSVAAVVSAENLKPSAPSTSRAVEPPKSTNVEPLKTKTVALPTTKTIAPPTTKTVEPPKSTNVEPLKTKTVEPPTTKTIEPPTTRTIAPPTTKTIAPPKTTNVEPLKTTNVEPLKTKAVEPPKTKTIEPPKTKTVEPLKTTAVGPPKTTNDAAPVNVTPKVNEKPISLPPSRNAGKSAPPLVRTASRATAGAEAPKRLAGTASLQGQIVDELGGLVVGATVTATDSAGTEKTAVTDQSGNYVVANLVPGEFLVRASAPGFADFEKMDVRVGSGTREILNIKLEVTIGKQEVTVADERGLGSSLNMRVLRGKDLAALPSGPGGLSAALRALAVPSTGPNGPQILINGFSGGRLPPKESIREIRISENPFSSEYPQLGFGRIEILTKPGSEKLQGSAFFNFNDESLNSRNPFSTERAPYQSRLYGGSLSGPIRQKRSSFFVDFERLEVNNNALINATVLDPWLNIVNFSDSIVTPQRRTGFSPRLEFELNKNNTLVARYSYSQARFANNGVGDFSLASRAYETSTSEQLLQLTETAVLRSNVINELRFQYLRNRRHERGNNSAPTVQVPEAFVGGGSQGGLSFNHEDRWELQNYTSWALTRHNIKAGVQVRGVHVTDSSTRDFGGTFTFAGGLAPALDAANNVVLDPAGQPVVTPISSIERFRRTQLIPLFQQRGLSAAEIRALGAGPTQFSIAGGNPTASVSQYDLGVFAQDDWQLRPNLTLGLGLRYEFQNNLNRRNDIAPRLALAWAPGGDSNARKTVVRAGIGLFYDRFSENYALDARRSNGVNEQRFIVSDPAVLDLYPSVPSLSALTAFAVPETITRLATDLRTPY